MFGPKIPAFAAVSLLAALLFVNAGKAQEIELGLPVDCRLGVSCFLQQLPDMDPGPGAKDPYCGSATYDGHKGTDIRVVSMADLRSATRVIAAASGYVSGLRDGVPDKLVASQSDRQAVGNRECGNGVVINHENGWQTQYCHLSRGSIAVKKGDKVEKGQLIGSIGASGLAQFPHVHLSVRKDGQERDPFTGRQLGSGCSEDSPRAAGLWSAAALAEMSMDLTQVLAAGFAAGPVDNAALMQALPEEPVAGSAALVGWASFINLEQGDRVRVTVFAPDGSEFARNESDAMPRSKASYSIFAGKKGQPVEGLYRLEGVILRGETQHARRETAITISR